MAEEGWREEYVGWRVLKPRLGHNLPFQGFERSQLPRTALGLETKIELLLG